MIEKGDHYSPITRRQLATMAGVSPRSVDIATGFAAIPQPRIVDGKIQWEGKAAAAARRWASSIRFAIRLPK